MTTAYNDVDSAGDVNREAKQIALFTGGEETAGRS
jgi:hypothetical protein